MNENKINDLIRFNEELENYFRNTIIPQLFVDADLVLRKFTPPAMKHFNLSKDDVGKPIDSLKDNFRFATITDNIVQVIDSNEILEKEIQTTDLRWYQMNILPYITRQDKKTNGVIITFVEITERIKDLQEQEKLIAEHETLLDTISHDIKNPLNNLALTIGLLKKASPENSADYSSYIKIIENSTKRIQHIVSELTDTRQEEHKYKAKEELINLENILEDVRHTITDNIYESGAVIASEVNVSEIYFSRRKIRSIIYNLVSNAIKFRSPDRKPEILIRTEREGDFIIISVKDNGIGIDPENKEAIFSKYQRIHSDIEGSGIGLHLVKEIVKSSGGKISLNSQPGKGSEFKVYLKAG